MIFDVTLADAWFARHMVHVEIGGGQPFTFGNPTAELGSIDIGFHLLLDAGGTPNADARLFRMTVTGDLLAAPEPGSLALFGLGLALLVSLYAFSSKERVRVAVQPRIWRRTSPVRGCNRI